MKSSIKGTSYTVQVGQTRTCFSFIADRWYPVANTSVDHLIKIQEYAETGTIFLPSVPLSSRLRDIDKSIAVTPPPTIGECVFRSSVRLSVNTFRVPRYLFTWWRDFNETWHKYSSYE